jgi:hypothetical protein
MRKKVKTIIKEYYDENVVCFDLQFLSAILEHCRSANLSSDELSSLTKKIILHGTETSVITMDDFKHITSK